MANDPVYGFTESAARRVVAGVRKVERAPADRTRQFIDFAKPLGDNTEGLVNAAGVLLIEGGIVWLNTFDRDTYRWQAELIEYPTVRFGIMAGASAIGAEGSAYTSGRCAVRVHLDALTDNRFMVGGYLGAKAGCQLAVPAHVDYMVILDTWQPGDGTLWAFVNIKRTNMRRVG